MQKIPTVFERDWSGDRSRVINQVHPGCEWVLLGKGIATRKLDGTCCLVRGGKLFKRRELRKGEAAPSDFESVATDDETGKVVGWVPVGAGPEDKWHREAFALGPLSDGTYELIGPKVQGNPEPEKVEQHLLIRHGEGMAGPVADVPRSFDALRGWLEALDIEGIVFHHPDGRKAKIKARDFGLRRGGRK